jgi:hypothetical protein
MFFSHWQKSWKILTALDSNTKKNRILHNLDKNSLKYDWIVSYAIHLKLIVEIYNDNELFTIHDLCIKYVMISIVIQKSWKILTVLESNTKQLYITLTQEFPQNVLDMDDFIK